MCRGHKIQADTDEHEDPQKEIKIEFWALCNGLFLRRVLLWGGFNILSTAARNRGDHRICVTVAL